MMKTLSPTIQAILEIISSQIIPKLFLSTFGSEVLVGLHVATFTQISLQSKQARNKKTNVERKRERERKKERKREREREKERNKRRTKEGERKKERNKQTNEEGKRERERKKETNKQRKNERGREKERKKENSLPVACVEVRDARLSAQLR
jgi:hypothetical protein